MTAKRTRAASPTLALLTALALTGCAAFDPNPGVVKVPTTPTAVGPTAPTPGAKLSDVLSGAASVGTKAIANGQVRVYNAATLKPVPLLAAGGQNYALRQIGATTDARGMFNFQMPVPRAGDVFRVVVSDGKRSVTTLISASRSSTGDIVFLSLSGGVSNDVAPSAGKRFSFDVTPATTLADASVRDLVLLSQTLTDEAESKLLEEVLQKGQDFAQQVSRNFTSGELSKVAERVDGTSGQFDPKALGEAMAKAGLERVFKQTVAESLQALSELRAVPSNVDKTVETVIDTKNLGVLTEAGFNVNLTGNSLSIDGNGLNIDFEVPSDVQPPDEPTLPTDLPVQDPTLPEIEEESTAANVASPGKPIASDLTKFNPTVKMSHAAGTLTLEVAQAAGQQDVDTIVARISKSQTGATFTAPAIGQNLAQGSSTSAVAPGTHLIEAVALTNAAPVPVSDRMGRASLVNPASVGHWKFNDSVIARVQIFDRPDYIYVTMTYMLNDAVTSNTGHTTIMNVAGSVLGLSASKLAAAESLPTGSVDIDLFSRAGNLLEVSDHIDAQ